MRALVIGSNGQDGSYLAETLLDAGFDVWGVARQAQSRYVVHPRFSHLALDLMDRTALPEALGQLKPDAIYYVAAIHGASGFSYEAGWNDALQVNVGGVHACLEFMRGAPETRLFYASSLKAFGLVPPAQINEMTPRKSECLYSITKNTASDLIDYYARHHGAKAIVGYLFNHDSPRRADAYFLPQLARALGAARAGRNEMISLRSLNFRCDWGSSREFMQFAVKLIALKAEGHFVFASGVTWNALALVETLFGEIGVRWQEFIEVNETPVPGAGRDYRADLSRLETALGARPRMHAPDVVRWIADARFSIKAEGTPS